MIRLQDVTKRFRTNQGVTTVADSVTATFPTGVSVGLLGRNGAGKSTLLQMIGGMVRPDAGRIEITGSVSWPVGFAGSFNRDLTGAQNARFVARVYGVDTDELVDFVADFAEIGAHFHQPLSTYSAGMRARLGLGIAIGIPFRTYLVDEVTAVGDAGFRKKSRALFLDRMQRSGAIMVSHSMAELRSFCTAGAVLEEGRLTCFNNLEAAIAQHHENLGVHGTV